MTPPTDLLVEPQHLDRIEPSHIQLDLVLALPLEFLKAHGAIPLVLDDGELVIGLVDPLDTEAYDAIVTLLSQATDGPWVLSGPPRRVVCPAPQIQKAISRCYYQLAGGTAGRPVDGEAVGDAGVQTQAEDLLSIANTAPAIKQVNQILYHAVQARASDIHIEPYETEAVVRFRIDGVLHPIQTLPQSEIAAVLSRIKIMANLNIAEHRLCQDGQSRIKIADDLVDVRVSVIPTVGGERIVLRLLDKGPGQRRLEQIGFGDRMLATFRRLVSLPNGIILLTGPTGSGKTTTLYAAIGELNARQRNILTVEDPVEYQLPGIGQMQVKPKIDLTFANCLRHILRQDPDIILIGEIRDRETAQIAVQASMTGHLVLSTLHTNDAASAVTRLIDMGVEPYLISSSLRAVVAQRLVRVICPDCKAVDPDQPHQVRAMALFGDRPAVVYRGRGCARCLQTGYLGRTGIFELLVLDDVLRGLVTQRTASHGLRQAAIERDMRTLRQDGLVKVCEGLTTIEEVLRVTTDHLEEA